MSDVAWAAASAAWLGILKSVMPCSMAMNVAAVTYLGKHAARPGRAVTAGLLYTAGRMAAYVAIASALMFGMQAAQLSHFFQSTLNKFLGPTFIVIGVVMLELIPLPWSVTPSTDRAHRLADRGGLVGAALLGVVFASAFCPATAAVFFGAILGPGREIAAHSGGHSVVIAPLAFGLGTGLPVVAFSVVMAFGAHRVSRMYDALKNVARWGRAITGTVFIGLGAYFTLVYIYGVDPF